MKQTKSGTPAVRTCSCSRRITNIMFAVDRNCRKPLCFSVRNPPLAVFAKSLGEHIEETFLCMRQLRNTAVVSIFYLVFPLVHCRDSGRPFSALRNLPLLQMVAIRQWSSSVRVPAPPRDTCSFPLLSSSPSLGALLLSLPPLVSPPKLTSLVCCGSLEMMPGSSFALGREGNNLTHL